MGGGLRRGFLHVVREPREGLRSGLVVQKLGTRDLHGPRLGSTVVCHGFVLPSAAAGALI
jgi:hypothetical protein